MLELGADYGLLEEIEEVEKVVLVHPLKTRLIALELGSRSQNPNFAGTKPRASLRVVDGVVFRGEHRLAITPHNLRRKASPASLSFRSEAGRKHSFEFPPRKFL